VKGEAFIPRLCSKPATLLRASEVASTCLASDSSSLLAWYNFEEQIPSALPTCTPTVATCRIEAAIPKASIRGVRHWFSWRVIRNRRKLETELILLCTRRKLGAGVAKSDARKHAYAPRLAAAAVRELRNGQGLGCRKHLDGCIDGASIKFIQPTA